MEGLGQLHMDGLGKLLDMVGLETNSLIWMPFHSPLVAFHYYIIYWKPTSNIDALWVHGAAALSNPLSTRTGSTTMYEVQLNT